MGRGRQGAGGTHDATLDMCALQCGNQVAGGNSSKEHVIPKAIGGRKTVGGFICRSCNSQTGEAWDAVLANQLKPLSLFLGIKRQGGSVPPQVLSTSDGGAIQLHPGGRRTISKPSVAIEREEGATRARISARSRKEARRVLKGLLKKHPSEQRSIDDLMSGVHEASSYSPAWTEVKLDFGGHKTGRSLVKSALALVYDAGIDPKSCNLALAYLLGEGGDPCFGFYYDKDRDLVIHRPLCRPFHCVYVKGNADSGTILGYVEYFSLHRVVLFLSDSYSGEDFENIDAIDPVSGERLDLDIDLELELGDVLSVVACEKEDWTVRQDAAEHLLGHIVNVDFDRALSEVIEEAIEQAVANCEAEPGEELTDRQVQQLVGDMMQVLEPFILHNSEKWRMPFGDTPDSPA